MRFALLGAAGYVARRHLQAIKDVGGELVAACDPHDSVGILDSYAPKCRFFTEIERFDRYLEKERSANRGIDYLVVCTPNYLHDAHCRLGLRLGADVICEKPLVINPWNLDQLAEQESRYDKRIYAVLQLRLHPVLQEVRAALAPQLYHCAHIRYVSPRGPWYHASWKGNLERSGGILLNIGVHLFDMLGWLFGKSQATTSFEQANHAHGCIWFECAEVGWELSIARTYAKERHMTINGKPIDFTAGFESLHTAVYRDILSGGGFGIEDARPAIELVHRLRNPEPSRRIA